MQRVKLIHLITPGAARVSSSHPSLTTAVMALLCLGSTDPAGESTPGVPCTQTVCQEDLPIRELSPIASTQPSPTRPEVAREDLMLLMGYARSAFRSKLAGLPEQAARFRPIDLKDLTGIIHLTLRSNGVSLAEAESPEMGVVDAAVAAGALLGSAAGNLGRAFEDHGDNLGIELEWLGPREFLHIEPFEAGGQWTDELLHSFEPAAEGIGVQFQGKSGWTRPAQIILSNYSPDLALKAAEAAIDLRHIQKLRFAAQIKYFRFWTYHLWQPSGHRQPTILERGEALVTKASITRDSLDSAIQRIGGYVYYRHRQSGAFAPEYLPGADRYNELNSARIQLRALRGFSVFAGFSPNGHGTQEEGVHADLARGIEAFGKYLESIDQVDPSGPGEARTKPAGHVLIFPGHDHHLELTGLLLSALCNASPVQGGEVASDPAGVPRQGPLPSGWEGLVTAILASQAEDGRLMLNLGSTRGDARSEEIGAACALLALAEAQALAVRRGGQDEPIRRTERALDAAFRYYAPREAELSAPARATLCQAFALVYERTKDAKLSDHVFRTADDLVRVQLKPDNCAYPELWGAINVRRPGLIGADSATYVETLARAAALAARVGDAQRRRVYRDATKSGVRFLLQLEFSPAGCYYVRSPRDALGGIRAAPWDHRIRVDHCSGVLLALVRARIALFGAPEAR